MTNILQNIQQAVLLTQSVPVHPEARLRELVAPIWEDFLRKKRINLSFYIREERQLANGRADTVFNRLILEYKKPGTINPSKEKNRKLISQVQGYIEDLAREEHWKEERLLGVAFDGNYFVFIYKVKRWIVEDPVAVSEKSVSRFLEMLEKLTSKAALVPDNLIKDFAVGSGARNFVASNAIRAFYLTLLSNSNPRVKALFDQWALQFAEVHGAFENKKFDAQTLFKSYGFKKEEQKDFNFLAFFFALDTYYALLMKLLAYQVVGFYTLRSVAGLPLSDWENLSSDQLLGKLKALEEGGIFRTEPLNIRNFLEGDLLSWYPDVWNEELTSAIRAIINRLNQYDPETMELLPDQTRDILKKLYQFLVPKQIRHDLGEYYTPDWLAERCLNQLGYGPKDPELFQKRLLDPGCGSGTFLVLAIKRLKEHARLLQKDPSATLVQITKNIVGFDLNPLAVISARTNYLLAVADLLRYKKGELTIPVYLCDSINPPSAKHQDELFDQQAGHYQISTSVGPFRFPEALVQRAKVQQVTGLLEDCVKKKHTTRQFLERVHQEMNGETDRRTIDLVLGETYEKLLDLEQKGINGIWARIIKNAFAPLFVGTFDFIAGNPPWVNWEALPTEYRDKTAFLWKKYDLFEHKGLRARLGSAKDDISVLMTYVVIDNYLKDNGKLCFVITQTLFKTVGGGEGFRRFRLGKNGTPFKIIQVDDMVDLQPFDSATNRTAVFLCQKGEITSYPIDYYLWMKTRKGSIPIDFDLKEVFTSVSIRHHKAQSIDVTEQGSWITGKYKALCAARKVSGNSHYQAREGTNTGGANGVLWVKITENTGSFSSIENLNEIGKKYVPAFVAEVESELLFPLLRGRDITRWNASPSINILIPQNLSEPSKAIDRKVIEIKYPKAFSFLSYFENELKSRALYKKYLEPQKVPFYGIYNIGHYTFSPVKVVWSEVGHNVQAAVMSTFINDTYLEAKIIVPDHTVVAVSLNEIEEAHYLCSILNSTPTKFLISGYVVLHPSPHILNNIKIYSYQHDDVRHRELSFLSMKCHEKTAVGISVTDLEEQIDELAAELWGLTKDELRDIKESLEEMR